MADISNLNFKVILDDDKFNKQIEADIKAAQRLNTQLSTILNLKKKLNSESASEMVNAEKVRQAQEKTTQEVIKTQLQQQKLRTEVERTRRAQESHTSALIGTQGVLRTLSQLTGVTFSVVGLRRFLSTLIDVTGQFEVQKMALRNMLQDIDGADKIFEDLYNFSSQSTYRFSELAKYAKQLAAFNIEQSSLLETTKMLGDVASGVGVSMDRLILAYGHVKSSGFLRGIQLRSFSQNGVPILEELSKMFTEIEGKAVSLGDVFDKMMRREIGFDMVEEAFKRMTSEGGKFYQMQEVLAKTLSGQINILKGKWENLMYAIGQSQEGILKGVVSSLTNIVSSTESFGRAITIAIGILGAYRVGLLATTIATEGLSAATSHGLIGALRGLVSIVAKNPYAILAAAITYCVIEIVKANNTLSDTEKITKALTDTTDKYDAALDTEMRELDLLVGRLRSARDGTDEYAAAKRALESRFAPYIQQLREEGVAVNNLAELYEGLAKKIAGAQKQRFLEAAQTSIVDAYKEATDNIERDTKALIANLERDLGRSLFGHEQGALRHYVSTGEKNSIFKSLGLDELRSTTRGAGLFGQELEFEGDSYYNLLRELYNRNTLAADTYSDMMVEAAKRFDSTQDILIDDGKKADENIVKISSIVEAIKKTDKDIAALRAKAARDGITESEEERLKSLVAMRDDDAKRYKEIMGVDYDKQVRATSAAETQASNERIRSLKAEISILEKYRDAREKLEPLFGDETNGQLAKLFGGQADDYNSVDTTLQTLIADLKTLGDEGKQAAEQIEVRLGMDALGLLIKRQTELKKYNDALQNYLGKDFSFSGSNTEYKASRILADYNTNVEKATDEYLALYEKARELGQETRTLGEQFSAQLEQLEAQRNEKFMDLAKSIFGQQTSGLSLSEWAHKSGREIKEIISSLEGISIPPEIAEMLDEKTLEALSDALEELSQAEIDKAFNALDENKLRNWQKWAKSVSEIGSALKEYGDASGNDALASVGEALSFISETASNVMNRVAQGDWAGAVLSVVGSIANEILKAATAAAQLDDALAQAVEKSRRLGMSNALKVNTESIFGDNAIAKARNAAELAEKLRKTAYDGKGKMLSGRDAFFLPKWETMIGNLADAVGGELYDAYGNLNADTLQLILDTYTKLDKESKAWIQHAIDDTEAYQEAMEQLKDVVSSVFSGVASGSADAIVTQWKERGNAALEYADIIDDVATRYAKMLIESAIYDQVLNENEAKKVMDLFAAGDREGAMARIADDMELIAAMEPVFTDILESFDPYFNKDSSDTDNSLRDGISKELVEGNSTLIASYLNAMRADVSVIRGLQTSGWQDVRHIYDVVPTLRDYAASMDAHLYDIEQSNREMLQKVGRIAGTVTQSSSGGSAIRTTK